MNEKKRLLSLSRRVRYAFVGGLLRAFIWLDIALLLLAFSGFFIYTEHQATGAVHWDTPRDIKIDVTLPVFERLDSFQYEFTVDGVRHSADGGEYFSLARRLYTALLIFEGAFLFLRLLSGKNSARWVLEPLSDISQSAGRLTGSDENGASLHSLEDAISRLSPMQEGARVETGVSELRGLEDAINHMLDRVRESYDQQARFVSDASHELRTPISVIQGYASLLERWGKTDPKVLEEGITAINAESHHMQTLVEQLLFLARGDSGRTKLTVAPFSLTDMMREVYEEYSMIDEDHEWLYEQDADVTAVGDPAMLKQTARILADNARKYSPKGRRVILRACRRDRPVFEVQDEGIGMSPEDAKHIFERFYRSDPARSRATGGVGLGLSIAKWIVDRHGGQFQVLTREGIGTRISVYLPGEPEPQGDAAS